MMQKGSAVGIIGHRPKQKLDVDFLESIRQEIVRHHKNDDNNVKGKK